MKRRADWLAWSLQFIFGLAVGAFIGFAVISRSHRHGRNGLWLALDQIPGFILGAALIGAGLTSLYGDRLWDSSYRVIPPDEIQHSRVSRIISIVVGISGGVIVLWFILRHFSNRF